VLLTRLEFCERKEYCCTDREGGERERTIKYISYTHAQAAMLSGFETMSFFVLLTNSLTGSLIWIYNSTATEEAMEVTTDEDIIKQFVRLRNDGVGVS
jgi:hypothetical protein